MSVKNKELCEREEIVLSSAIESESKTELERLMPLCEVFVKSGIFDDIKDIAQAIVKVLAGRELGLSPLESMMGLYIVKGRIAASAKIVSSLIKKSDFYDYVIEKLTDEECVISFVKVSPDGVETEIGKSIFTIKDAARAGVVNGVNWKGYPRNMLFARAISNGARWYTPEIFSGYSQEELEGVDFEPKKDIVSINSNGEVVKNG